jgi:sucrose-6F-phosphate phosphohydrolase
LDGTLLGKEDATRDFATSWQALPESRRPLLVYNTGRVAGDARRVLRDSCLPDPDYLIAGVGTMVVRWGESGPLRSFADLLVEGWDRARIDEIVRDSTNATPQPQSCQTETKSSWFWHDATTPQIKALEKALRDAGQQVQLVYSSSRDLDLLPRFANKGNALEWLCGLLEIPLEQVVVAGDTGNDATMFLLPGVRGILVENAEPELMEAVLEVGPYCATGICADGVIEGLIHFGVMKRRLRSRSAPEGRAAEDPYLERLFDGGGVAEATPEALAEVSEAYHHAVAGLRRCISPMGFTACSIHDNNIRGTDENYHAVWGRDGSITVIGSLGLDDPDIRACQRATLETLLTHVAPTGHVPANVSLRTGKPDYSGVGGIAAVDSAMWLVIAAHQYAVTTRDMGFVRRHRATLALVMQWLAALDSNLDGLIEVPEAGDWMDLFNRSYNVLTDEVLWYRANIAWARLLEMGGDTGGAALAIARAERVKRAINRTFWPSTRSDPGGDTRSFTQVQRSLGDASYYLAQVSPFGFDWRCDVFGNVLAFLFNVMDLEKAKIAFRFMWGVGVNDPYPVANLYPIVNAGDPDWRSYYTVNLLNLPNHYHNGGVWPYVGAMWVRFILRLGLRGVAFGEMLKLARLNRQGVAREWEFNEWAHGVTGRPMGKAYQAWSCSEFIRSWHAFTHAGAVDPPDISLS